jgi:hypothetical protein
MSLTIAKALKEKNKKLSQLNKLWKRLDANNSIPEGNVREFNPQELIDELRQEMEAYVTLKTQIHNACVPVRDKIFRLSEWKSFIQRLKSIDTNHGLTRTRYDSSLVKYEAYLSAGSIENLIEQIETEIEKIQEELDHFNYTNYLK